MAKRKKTVVRKTRSVKKENSDLIIDDDFQDPDDIAAEPILEEVEDDTEFISKVKEFEETHKNAKLINVYKLIGKPSLSKTKKVNPKHLKDEYDKLITILDKNKIIVHFQNEYPIEEKYRFITEEIFKQDIENTKKCNLHISFIYEDFHPEMIDEDEIEI
jgi:hypothetical protein